MGCSFAVKTLCVTLLCCTALAKVVAAEAGPSDTSIRELMEVSGAQQILKTSLAGIDSTMRSSMTKAMEGKNISASQREIIDDMGTQMAGVITELLNWRDLEPLIADIYKRTFTQREIDGMLSFYKSEAGRAVVTKMPLVLQNSNEAMQGRVAEMLPKLQKIQEEALAKLKAGK